LSGRFQTTRKAEIELNFFEYSNSKRYLAAPDIVEYSKINRPQYDEPQSTQDATKHVTRILDANYKRADLQSIVKDKCKHFATDQQKKLLQLLTKYELLFDGTLGDWKTKPVSF
jgi:hypothetical protein